MTLSHLEILLYLFHSLKFEYIHIYYEASPLYTFLTYPPFELLAAYLKILTHIL